VTLPISLAIGVIGEGRDPHLEITGQDVVLWKEAFVVEPRPCPMTDR
jgi:hypothetical protein